MKFLLGMLVVAAFLSAAPTGHADQFNFTFTPETSMCVSNQPCLDSGSGTFTTAPYTFTSSYPGAYPILSMTGNIDGFSITGESGGSISLAGEGIGAGNCSTLACQPPIGTPVLSLAQWGAPVFYADGHQWSLQLNDLPGPWGMYLSEDNSLTTWPEPVNLTITRVPEPSTFLLLIVGICLAWIIRARAEAKRFG